MNTLTVPRLARAKSLLLGCAAAALLAAAASPLTAQTATTYTVVDLSAATGGQAAAYASSGGQAAGTNVSPAYLNYSHAFLWTGNGATDLHPGPLLGESDVNSSVVQGFAGNLQVGWGFGSNTQGRYAALTWRDTAASARPLGAPFPTLESQAFGTDSTQIVGYAAPNTGKITAHAMTWNAATGAATDLGDGGGKGAVALGVARGQQVGYTYQSQGEVAALWTGTSRSLVVLHPKNSTLSQAVATDGTRQVGFIANDVRSAAESVRTNRFYYPVVWNNTAASARTLSVYPLTQGFATGVNASVIVGYAYEGKGSGVPAKYHAMLWNAALQPTDLNAFLPPGYTGAMANAVDAQGNVAGTIFTTDGQPHAAVWLPNR